MKFGLVSYQVVAQEDREVMIAELVKDTEYQSTPSLLYHGKTDKKPTGIAGTMTLHIYEKSTIERFKKSLGKEVEVDVRV